MHTLDIILGIICIITYTLNQIHLIWTTTSAEYCAMKQLLPNAIKNHTRITLTALVVTVAATAMLWSIGLVLFAKAILACWIIDIITIGLSYVAPPAGAKP